MKIYTDFPINRLGDKAVKIAPIREVEVISYDGYRYVTVKVEDITLEIKSGHLYTEPGRCGEVPRITQEFLTRLPKTYE